MNYFSILYFWMDLPSIYRTAGIDCFCIIIVPAVYYCWNIQKEHLSVD